MTGIEVGGLALGAISVTFQVFAGAVKGYHLIITAIEMPKTHEYLKVRLKLELNRLLQWAAESGLALDGEGNSIGLRLNRHAVNDVLHEIEKLLLDYDKLTERYKLSLSHERDIPGQEDNDDLTPAVGDEPKFVLKRALGFIKDHTRIPKRVRWVAGDRAAMEELVQRLATLNDKMVDFLDNHQRQQHYKQQEEVFTSILQMHNKLDDLMAIVASSTIASGTERGPQQWEVQSRMRHLSRFKAIQIAIDFEEAAGWELLDPRAQEKLRPIVATKLDMASYRPQKISVINASTTIGTYGSELNSVWVEWKYVDAGVVVSETEERISRLSKLLMDKRKPREFRAPTCLGYLEDASIPSNTKFGLVFTIPSTPGNWIPLSLRQLLLDTTQPKPPLSLRIRAARAIANSLWYLHATGWLHKGLRSDSIQFLDGTSIAEPTLSGFDYARPATTRIRDITETPSYSPRHELYRHKDVRFDVPRQSGYGGFQKVHDVYSLGVLLMEIGLWQPIERLLGIAEPESITIGDLGKLKVWEMLVTPTNIGRLEGEAGQIYASVAKCCLKGDFQVPQQHGTIDFQMEVNSKVIEKLSQIVV